MYESRCVPYDPQMQSFVEKRNIKVPGGWNLEVDMTPEFISKVQKHFGLEQETALTDEQLQLFVVGTINSAVDKAERQGT